MIIDLKNLDASSTYAMMTQTIIPRPIAWVLSQQDKNTLNLAPFSYFSAVSSAPPLVMLSIGKQPTGEDKDTYLNIVEQKQFVIHIADETFADAISLSAKALPRDQSELALCELETTYFEGFDLPRVVGPKIALACQFYSEQTIGVAGQHLIFGQVEAIWLDDNVVTTDTKGRLKVLADHVRPLSRLGGSDYQVFDRAISIVRP